MVSNASFDYHHDFLSHSSLNDSQHILQVEGAAGHELPYCSYIEAQLHIPELGFAGKVEVKLFLLYSLVLLRVCASVPFKCAIHVFVLHGNKAHNNRLSPIIHKVRNFKIQGGQIWTKPMSRGTHCPKHFIQPLMSCLLCPVQTHLRGLPCLALPCPLLDQLWLPNQWERPQWRKRPPSGL